jgi:hypothetical protein
MWLQCHLTAITSSSSSRIMRTGNRSLVCNPTIRDPRPIPRNQLSLGEPDTCEDTGRCCKEGLALRPSQSNLPVTNLPKPSSPVFLTRWRRPRWDVISGEELFPEWAA